MADWIKARVNLHETAEVLDIAAIMGMDRFAVIGRLIRIWAWFDQHTNNGDAWGVSDATLDGLVRDIDTRNAPVTLGCESAQKSFTSAMRTVKWLHDIERNGVRGLRIPKWARHNGTTGKKRANGQRRSQRFRNARTSRSALPEERRGDKNIHTPCGPPEGDAAAGGKTRKARLTRDEKRAQKVRELMAAEPSIPVGGVK